MLAGRKARRVLGLVLGLLGLVASLSSLSIEAKQVSFKKRSRQSVNTRARGGIRQLKRRVTVAFHRKTKLRRFLRSKQRVRKFPVSRGRGYARRSTSYRGGIRRWFPLSPLPPVGAGVLLLGEPQQRKWYGLAPVDLQGQVSQPEVGVLWTWGDCRLTYHLEGKYRRLHGRLRVLRDFPEGSIPRRVRCQMRTETQTLYDTGWLRPGEDLRFFLNLTDVEKLEIIVQPEEVNSCDGVETATPTVEWRGLTLW